MSTRVGINKHLLATLFGVAFIADCGSVSAADWLTDYPAAAMEWYRPAEQKVQHKAAQFNQLGAGKARNIILFVGDGMGVSTVTAARIFAGQQQGLAGEEYQLAFDKFPMSGLSHTYNINMQTPDSAGTMTAIITGVKSRAGIISLNGNAHRHECDTQQNNELFSALELAELAGMATGVVSTARITHATPAATYASSVERNWEADAFVPRSAQQQGCEDIAGQLIDFPKRLAETVKQQAIRHQRRIQLPAYVDGPDVILGGGLSNFLPSQLAPLAAPQVQAGRRKDGRNLLVEWRQANPEGSLVYDRQALMQTRTSKLLGLFSASHMAYDAQRQTAQKKGAPEASQPSLQEMTAKAIEVLAGQKKGFFLVVEAGRIDHAHHAGNAFNALSDTVALSQAVATAVEKTDSRDTLIIVTADHSHVFTMAGYPVRGNPILGLVQTPSADDDRKSELALDITGKPYTTLGYMNGPGFAFLPDNADPDDRLALAAVTGRHSLKKVATDNRGYHQEALVGLGLETHGGEDVAIYAQGPGAYLVSGSNEQNVIFHVMNFAGQLVQRAQQALEVRK